MLFDKKRAQNLLLEFTLAGLNLSNLQWQRFLRLDNLLVQNIDELDLTRTDPKMFILKHYLDSAAAAGLMTEPAGPVLDLGSGAGFPGLPIGIIKPDWPIILAEPRLMRLAFIDQALAVLGLPNINVYPHKVGASFSLPIDSIITRDFGPLKDILELAAPILPEGGRVFLMKGSQAEEEIAEAKSCPAWSQFGDPDVKYYRIGPLERSFLTLKKIKAPKAKSFLKPRWSYNSLEIASRRNSQFKAWLKLLEGRNLRKYGQTLASGHKIVKEILSGREDLILGLLAVKPRDLDGFQVNDRVPVYFIRPEIFPALDVLGTGGPLIWLKTPEIPPWDINMSRLNPWLLVPFQDPVNVGAVIRTAAAMDSAVVLLKEAASPYHYKAVRTAGPAVFQVPLFRGPGYKDLPDLNRDDLMALSPRGLDIYQWTEPSGGVGLVLGPEGPGLEALWPENKKLSIPMKSGVESLNGAAAAAMALAILKTRHRQELTD
ncbi:MAG: class I SAM-dependent methyltransferase [Deltaproteobacteria bacterium]|jgi:16S rRNA (guanine527-N7)-methyltransferase|nr:class I SAM-dependent methyltransferase [Deltaproteobacteria bacterium]